MLKKLWGKIKNFFKDKLMSEVTITRVGGENNKVETIGNVIFVHGLEGNPMTSWTNSGNGGFWPEWLAEDFPQLNIWTIGYEAALTAWKANTLPLQARATTILERLATTEELGDKPICFITHSMGGLVVKQMLNTGNTQNIARYKKVTENTRGVVYIATPHDGAGLASLLNSPLKLIFRPNVTVAQLEKTHPTLMNLKDWYSNNARKLNIETLAFYEGYPTKNVIVVNEASARPGIE